MATYENTVSSPNLTTAFAGTPGAGDSAYCNRGADDYNAGMDFAGDLALFQTTAGFNGSFGADGSQLGLLSTAGKIVFEGGRLINMKNNGTNARVEVRLANAAGRVQLHDNTVTLLICDTAYTRVVDTCDANTVRANGSARVQLDKHAATTTDAVYARHRSTVSAERPVTNVYLRDQATFIARETCAPTVAAEGGTYIHEGGSNPTLGDCANCVLDFSRVRVPITVGGTPTFDSGVVIIVPGDPALVTLPAITNRGAKHEVRVAA